MAVSNCYYYSCHTINYTIWNVTHNEEIHHNVHPTINKQTKKQSTFRIHQNNTDQFLHLMNYISHWRIQFTVHSTNS